MRHPIRALAIACALTLTPACAALGVPTLENPVAAAHTIDQRAYALLNSYAAVIEEATDIVRDPAAPIAFKRAMGQAERAATPAAETLEIAIAAYVRARNDFEASEGQTQLQRATAALTIAAQRLNQAITAAQGPIHDLEDLVAAHR
jgi:hypothetical protein